MATYKACRFARCHQQDEATDHDDDDDDNDNVDNVLLANRVHDTYAHALTRCLQSDVTEERFGLERVIVKQLFQERYFRRKQLLAIVLKIQASPSSPPATTAEDEGDHYHQHNVKAQVLRESSQAFTLPSRLFARQMGRACCVQDNYV